MSEQLRHKMKDLEVVPPPAAWEAIASRLSDDKAYATVSFKMNNFEVAPPAAWEFIADRLNDDKQHATVSLKMNNFEVAPPAQAWDNILLSLEETTKEKAPVINIRRIIYRVAAAAVITGLSIGGWLMLNKTSPKNDVAVTKTNSNTASTKVQPSTTTENTTIPDNSVTASQKQDNADAALQINEAAVQHNTASNHHVQAADNNRDKSIKSAIVDNLPADNKTALAVTAPQLLDKDGNPIADMDVLTTSNYLVVTGPNGQLTRISSKFASVIRYLDSNDTNDTEEYLDKVIKESGTWKKRFQEWRNKISQSTYIPSSVNFLDIVEFKDLIQEKQ